MITKNLGSSFSTPFQDMLGKHILWSLVFLFFFFLFKLPDINSPLFAIISFAIILRFFKGVRLKITSSLVVLALFYTWAFMSYRWSIDKAATADAIISHIGLLISAVGMAVISENSSVDWKKPFKFVLLSIVLWNLKALLFDTYFAITDMGFCGIYGHKNYAGLYLGVILFFLLMLKPSGKIEWAITLLCALFLLATLSKTSIAAFVLAFAFSRFLSNMQQTKSTKGLLWFWGMLIFVSIALIPWDIQENIRVFQELLPDDAFTGRGGLWKSVMLLVQNPLQGMGLEAIWYGSYGRILGMTSDVAIANPLWFEQQLSVDGGYVDLYLDLGLIGVLFAILFIVGIILDLNSTTDLFLKKNTIGILTFFMVHNFFESSIMKTRLMLWFLIVWVVFRISLKKDKEVLQ